MLTEVSTMMNLKPLNPDKPFKFSKILLSIYRLNIDIYNPTIIITSKEPTFRLICKTSYYAFLNKIVFII